MSRIYLTIMLSLCLLSTLHANEGKTAFQQAMQAFKSGEYVQAMEWFEQARSQGMSRPALYYNLGVTYFRLERWHDAQTAFEKTADYPTMAPLAYYNLGLVKRKQNDVDSARDWFMRCLDTTQDIKLVTLANDALAALPRKKSSWSSFFSVGLGYDDNITLENDSLNLASNESDTLLELFGFTQGLLIGSHHDGLLFRGSLFSDLYTSQSDYSLTEVNLGLYKRFRLQEWNNESGLYLTYSTLGGEPYLSSTNLSLNARRNLSNELGLRFRVRLKAIQSLDQDNDGLEGSAFDLRTEGRWAMRENTRFRTYYQLELNDRDGSATATTFTSLSPTRHGLYLDYLQSVLQNWQLKLSGSYRLSDYDEENLEADGTTITRKDERVRMGIELNRRFWDRFQLAVEYSHTDNSSNIDRYSYQRNMILASLMLDL
ncbi:MAG: hypothetical protein LC541_03430 [Candidatus Thiodiazotropha sp.]|nr:hypothetical protein [Candidatus Thiodiazotropha sp.]MCM8920381.1 hypothetical protein [Candidatus Thiodiazotropha sp.]